MYVPLGPGGRERDLTTICAAYLHPFHRECSKCKLNVSLSHFCLRGTMAVARDLPPFPPPLIDPPLAGPNPMGGQVRGGVQLEGGGGAKILTLTVDPTWGPNGRAMYSSAQHGFELRHNWNGEVHKHKRIACMS